MAIGNVVVRESKIINDNLKRRHTLQEKHNAESLSSANNLEFNASLQVVNRLKQLMSWIFHISFRNIMTLAQLPKLWIDVVFAIELEQRLYQQHKMWATFPRLIYSFLLIEAKYAMLLKNRERA